jgi:hypothetical protein
MLFYTAITVLPILYTDSYSQYSAAILYTGSYSQSSPSVLEARYSWSADSCPGLAVAGSVEMMEDQLRQHLADAMNESPQKEPRSDGGKGENVYYGLHYLNYNSFTA